MTGGSGALLSLFLLLHLAGAVTLVHGPRRQKPVQWYHVHKAGGTTICALAEAMGERVIQPSALCNMFQDSYQQRDAQFHFNCTERRAAFEIQRATWSALEVPLEEGSNFCPGDFYYGTVVREPLDRLESHLGWQSGWDESYLELPCRYDVLIAHLAATNVTEDLRRACYRQLPALDNYLVRMFGGREVARLPAGGVGQQHFEKARAVLDRFDLVVPLEVLSTDEHVVLDLNRELGWHLRPEDVRQIFHPEGFNKVMREERTEHKVHLSSEQLRHLSHLNRFDTALYNDAMAKYRSKLVAPSRGHGPV